MLVMMQVSRRLDLENPTILMYVRVAYATCQITILLVYLYVRSRIASKNDLTTLKFVKPAAPMLGQAEGAAVVTTVKEYDLEQVDAAIKSVFTSLAMMGFMHIYMKYTNPLVMQSVSSVKSALETNIVKIHLFNTPATGDLKRPFKSAPGLLEAFTGGNLAIKTDKQLVESAETAGSGGIKQD